MYYQVSLVYRRDLVLGLVVTRTSSRSYSRDLATRTCISSRPMLTDPYEDRSGSIIIIYNIKTFYYFPKNICYYFIIRYSLVI